MEAAESGLTEERTYGNWRAPRTAGIGGLGLLGTMILMGGMILVIIVVALAGIVFGLALVALLALALAPMVVRDKHGRTGLQRIGARVGWQRTVANGSHIYRSGPLGRTPWGTCQLPGLLAPSRLSEGLDALARPFALLAVPSSKHYTVVLAADPDGASLVDQEQVDVLVAGWGDWLSALGDEEDIVSVAVTVETAPDPGGRLRREVERNMDPAAPSVAREMLMQVVDEYPAGAATVSTYLSLTFSSVAANGRRKPADEMARDLAARLPELTSRLQATGAGMARPMSAQELCEVVRTAYDPAAASLFDEARTMGVVPDLRWPDVGPSASEEHWDYVRHEGAYSVTWAMTAAPRGNVHASILYPLLSPHRAIAVKRVTLTYQTMDRAVAARIVEADIRNARFRATTKATPTERDKRAMESAITTAKEEAVGASLVNFGMIVTATVRDYEQLPDAEQAINSLGARTRILLRPVYGSQACAFAAGLPLGLVLSSHLAIPSRVRDAV